MSNFPILSFLILFPLLGAFLIALFVKKDAGKVALKAALWVTLFPLILSLAVWFDFDASNSHIYQLEEKLNWLPEYGINYHLGVDGISLFFIVLTGLLMPICILCSWHSVKKNIRDYAVLFLLLESFVMGVFVSLDFILFYFFFEAVLIPMYFIIGIWGGKDRIYASFKFFLYTLAGSLFLLLAIIYIYSQTGTTDIVLLMEITPQFGLEIQKWLWLAFFISFAVKVPMWPVHTWLPDAHVQAPTAGSVILAGVLLKLGGYGFLRLALPLLPDASIYFADFVFILSLVAVVYTSLVALVQTDMKKLIAYSSIAHMGFVTLGIFAFNKYGLEGSIFQMISHGLVSAALFLCVGVLYDRLHTKEIKKFGGVVNVMPKYALIFLFFCMASIGLPATSGFVGEFAVLTGLFQVNKIFTAIASLGVILGAGYMLWLYARVVLGELTNKELSEVSDLDKRDMFMFVALALAVLLLGIYPAIITDYMHGAVEHLERQIFINQR